MELLLLLVIVTGASCNVLLLDGTVDKAMTLQILSPAVKNNKNNKNNHDAYQSITIAKIAEVSYLFFYIKFSILL